MPDRPLRDLDGSDLARQRLAGSDLAHASLRRADLRGADLRGADLRGADLRGADLDGSNLSHAPLHGADLRDTLVGRRELGHPGGDPELQMIYDPTIEQALADDATRWPDGFDPYLSPVRYDGADPLVLVGATVSVPGDRLLGANPQLLVGQPALVGSKWVRIVAVADGGDALVVEHDEDTIATVPIVDVFPSNFTRWWRYARTAG